MAQVEAGAGLADATGPEMDDYKAELAALRREVATLRLANSELERLALRDTLTPLYNRRYFISSLAERISRVARYDARAVVLFIDVDNLKAINDSQGHATGDFVLMHLADLLSNAIRASDIAARIGGDEFALILDQMDERLGTRKMEALDRLVRETPCNFGGLLLPVSASFGVTVIRADDTESAIIARADEAMYRIKRQRRGM